MAENLDNLKKAFIVNQEEYSKAKVSTLISKILPFCKITDDGQVLIMKKVPTRRVIKLILSARLLANAIDKKISAELSRNELLAYSGLKTPVFVSRFNETLRENFTAVIKEDKYRARNILMVEQFLNLLGGEQDE